MNIGEVVEVGERVIETPKIAPHRTEPREPAKEPAPAEREKEDA